MAEEDGSYSTSDSSDEDDPVVQEVTLIIDLIANICSSSIVTQYIFFIILIYDC